MPSVTTARIIGRTWSSAAGVGAVAAVVTSVGRPRTSWGTTGAPRATVAATSAMPSGLASTCPCPNAVLRALHLRRARPAPTPVIVVSAGTA